MLRLWRRVGALSTRRCLSPRVLRPLSSSQAGLAMRTVIGLDYYVSDHEGATELLSLDVSFCERLQRWSLGFHRMSVRISMLPSPLGPPVPAPIAVDSEGNTYYATLGPTSATAVLTRRDSSTSRSTYALLDVPVDSISALIHIRGTLGLFRMIVL
jgi:hypothetical protein